MLFGTRSQGKIICHFERKNQKKRTPLQESSDTFYFAYRWCLEKYTFYKDLNADTDQNHAAKDTGLAGQLRPDFLADF